jgi:hypothetical protein
VAFIVVTHRYSVYCSNRYYPQYGYRVVPVTAPTKKWIRDNWLRIVGNTAYKIERIDLIY